MAPKKLKLEPHEEDPTQKYILEKERQIKELQ